VKNIILTLTINLFCISFINANIKSLNYYQAHSNDEKLVKMTALLNLTADQQKKYKILLDNSEKEKQALKAKLKSATKEEQKKMKDAFKADYENKLSKILTKEQLIKLKNEASKHK